MIWTNGSRSQGREHPSVVSHVADYFPRYRFLAPSLLSACSAALPVMSWLALHPITPSGLAACRADHLITITKCRRLNANVPRHVASSDLSIIPQYAFHVPRPRWLLWVTPYEIGARRMCHVKQLQSNASLTAQARTCLPNMRATWVGKSMPCWSPPTFLI